MAADQEFRGLIKSLNRFLKAFHHARMIQFAENQNHGSAGLECMAKNITMGVHPALPSVDTNWLIYGNAQNWLHTRVDILHNLYWEALQISRAKLLDSS